MASAQGRPLPAVLARTGAALDDGRVISAVEALAADERGVVLGLLHGGTAAGAARLLVGACADRCREALDVLAASSGEARTAARASLLAEARAEVPAGLGRVHPGWLRRVLATEPSAIIRAVVDGLPAVVQRVGDEIVRARGDGDGGEGSRAMADRDLGGFGLGGFGIAGVRRALFAALAPMLATPGGPPRAQALCALSFAGLIEEIDQRGAAALGLALAGAPDAVLARAAAGVGEPLARVVLASARGAASPEARAAARGLVAGVPPGDAAQGAARAVGLRAVAREVTPEGARGVGRRGPAAAGRPGPGAPRSCSRFRGRATAGPLTVMGRVVKGHGHRRSRRRHGRARRGGRHPRASPP